MRALGVKTAPVRFEACERVAVNGAAFVPDRLGSNTAGKYFPYGEDRGTAGAQFTDDYFGGSKLLTNLLIDNCFPAIKQFMGGLVF